LLLCFSVTHGGLADSLGQFVAYLASLGAATGVAGRFLVDWGRRDLRRPSFLTPLSPQRRARANDEHAWHLWIGTAAGALTGLVLGLLALAADVLQR
jgi:hypothetical protein